MADLEILETVHLILYHVSKRVLSWFLTVQC